MAAKEIVKKAAVMTIPLGIILLIYIAYAVAADVDWTTTTGKRLTDATVGDVLLIAIIHAVINGKS